MLVRQGWRGQGAVQSVDELQQQLAQAEAELDAERGAEREGDAPVAGGS